MQQIAEYAIKIYELLYNYIHSYEYETYTQFIQLDGILPKSNNLIKDDEHPESVQLECVFKEPITNIVDISLLSFYYSNEHHRITENNNVFRIWFKKQNLNGSNNYWYYDFKVEPGNYTTASLEAILNLKATEAGLQLITPWPTNEGNEALNVNFNYTDAGNGYGEKRVFEMTGHEDPADVGRCVLNIVVPSGFSMFVVADQSNNIDSWGVPSIAFELGYTKSKNNFEIEVKNDTLNAKVLTLKGEKYINLLFDLSSIHVLSNSIGQIAEFQPSINNIQGRHNIIYTCHTNNQALEAIVHTNNNIEQTRIKTKKHSSLNKIDISILDDKYEIIKNSRIDSFSITLIVRRLKKR